MDAIGWKTHQSLICWEEPEGLSSEWLIFSVCSLIMLMLSYFKSFQKHFLFNCILRFRGNCLSVILRSWGKSWNLNSQNLLSWGRGDLPLMKKTGIKTSSQKLTIFHNLWLTSLNRYGGKNVFLWTNSKPKIIYKYCWVCLIRNIIINVDLLEYSPWGYLERGV